MGIMYTQWKTPNMLAVQSGRPDQACVQFRSQFRFRLSSGQVVVKSFQRLRIHTTRTPLPCKPAPYTSSFTMQFFHCVHTLALQKVARVIYLKFIYLQKLSEYISIACIGIYSYKIYNCEHKTVELVAQGNLAVG